MNNPIQIELLANQVLASDGDQAIGHVLFTVVEDRILMIKSTEVEPDYRHRGIGRAMVERLVSYAMHSDLKVIAFCPFALRVFESSEEWRQLLLD